MRTNVQIGIERQRAVYEMPRTLLAQLAEVHSISVRDFAKIFGISKSYAEEILNHKKMPSLELGIRIARYYELSTDELFSWRVDDDGARRPLVVRLPGSETYMTLNASNRNHSALALLATLAEKVRLVLGGRKREARSGEFGEVSGGAGGSESGEVAEGDQQGVRDVSGVGNSD
jgi:transcriptional regulator with XRE-family HTH domain